MRIEKIQIEYLHKSGFTSSFMNEIRHIKTLPYLSVVQAVKGNYDIQLAVGSTQNTGCGGFFIAPPDVQQTITHHSDPTDHSMVCRWIFLKIKINDAYDFADLYQFPLLVPQAAQPALQALFDQLFAANNPFDEYACCAQIAKMLSQLATKRARIFSPAVERTLNYMKSHYKTAITVAELAAQAHVSASRLFAVFKKEIGGSPMAYLNHYRLSLAAAELTSTNKTITEIAASVGIADGVYFNKLFRKTYQLSPSQYRKIQKNKA